GAPVAKSPAQSVRLPGPFAIVAVTCAPGDTVVALSAMLGTANVMVGLVASRVNESLRKKRTSYEPGVSGNVKVSVAAVWPVAGGVKVPFKYTACRALVAGAFVAKSPTQSVRLPGPFAIVAVTCAPGDTVVALSAMLGGNLMVALVASRVYESLRKKRTSYVPGVTGNV